MEERNGVALCFEALAWMQTRDTPRRAATLLGAADALWKVMGTSVEAQPGLAPLRRTSESTLIDSLGEVEFRKAHTQGNTMGSSAAIAYALEESTAPPGPVDKSRQTGPPGLTKREGEIAQLVMAGLSNKEIASKLVISQRTAETHVEHILTKLGFTSRTQIAAWMSGHAQESRAGEER